MWRLPLNTLLKISLLGVSLLVAACGDTGSTSTGVPVPANPSNPGGTLPTTTNTDSRIPDLTGAAPINLQDKVNFTALSEILASDGKVFRFPIVLEPLIKMTLDNKIMVSGKLLVAFEDKNGFWGAELPTVEGASVQNSTNFDTIHSDSGLSFRVLGSVVGNDIYGAIYYRVRKQTPTMETQCLKTTVRCINPATGQVLPDSYCTYTNTTTMADTCRTYMNPGDSNVKFMGTFQSKVSDWFKN